MIAIKDMEMPKCCIDCPFLKADTSRKFFCERMMKYIDKNELESRHKDCPLLEIITCKDCKYCRFELVEGIPYYWCDKDSCATSEDYYCGGGRRE